MYGNEFEGSQQSLQQSPESRDMLNQDLAVIREALADEGYFGSNRAQLPSLDELEQRVFVPTVNGDFRAREFFKRNFGKNGFPLLLVTDQRFDKQELPEANFWTTMSGGGEWWGIARVVAEGRSFQFTGIRMLSELQMAGNLTAIRIMDSSNPELSIRGHLRSDGNEFTLNKVMIAADRWDLASPLIAFADLNPGWAERFSSEHEAEAVRKPEPDFDGFVYTPGWRQPRPVVRESIPEQTLVGAEEKKEEFPVQPVETPKPVAETKVESPYGYYASKEELDNAVSRAKSRASREAREEKDALYKGQRRRGTSGGIGADRITEILSGVTQSDGYGDTWKPNYSSGLPDEQKKDTNRPKSKFERKARQAAKKAAQKGKRK